MFWLVSSALWTQLTRLLTYSWVSLPDKYPYASSNVVLGLFLSYRHLSTPCEQILYKEMISSKKFWHLQIPEVVFLVYKTLHFIKTYLYNNMEFWTVLANVFNSFEFCRNTRLTLCFLRKTNLKIKSTIHIKS